MKKNSDNLKVSFKDKLRAFLQSLKSFRSRPMPMPLALTMDAPTRKAMFLLGGLLLLLAFVRLLTFPLLFPLQISPDQSMFVAIGELLLHGKRLYVEVFDVNPPLAFCVHVVPIMVSNLFNIPPPQAFGFSIIACWLYSVGFSLWLLWRQATHKEAFLFVPLVVSFSSLTLWLSRMDEFGQREHIFLLLFFPFFIVRWLRWNGNATSPKAAIVAGSLAAVGLFFKQYYLGAAVILELLWFIEKPRWRNLIAPETIACAVFGLLYACCILAMPQDMKDGYFSFMVPIFAAGYSEYGTSIMFQFVGWAQTWNDRIYLLIIACALGMAMMRYSTLIMPLIAFSLLGLVSYLLQGQPWLNHALPFVAGSYMLLGVEVAIAACVLRQYALMLFKRPSGIWFDIVWIAALLIWQGQIAVQAIIEQRQRAVEADKIDLALVGYKGAAARGDSESLCAVILRYTKIGDPVLFITRSIAPGYPLLLQTKRQPASRYLHGMLLPTLIYASDNAGSESANATSVKAKMDGFRAKVVADYKEDIRRNRPKLILIQSTRMWDILQDSKIIQDPIFEQYQFAGIVDDHRVYIRRDLVAPPN